MDYKQLTSPCGIDCFNCNVYKDNITEQMKSYLAATLKKDINDVACKGCRSQGGCAIYPLPCDTLKCTKEKGVDFCYECAEFPCEKLTPCAEQSEKYPHNIKVYNLCKISKIGLEKWAEEANDIRERYSKVKFMVGKGPMLK